MQYNSLKAYDTACRNKRKIELELQNTEAGKTYTTLRIRLNELKKEKQQQLDRAQKLKVEFDKVSAEYKRRLDDYSLEAEDFAGRKDDPEIKSVEYEECRTELEKIRRSVGQLRRQLHDIADEADKVGKTLERISKDASSIMNQYQDARSRNIVEKSVRKPELDRIASQQADLERSIDKSLLDKYKSIAESKLDPIANVREGRCSGCNISLPITILSKINSGELTICENCGRMIINI